MPALPLTPILHAFEGHTPAAPGVAPGGRTEVTLGVMLLREGTVAAHDLIPALALQSRQRGKLIETLLSHGLVSEPALYTALARHWAVGIADLIALPPDPRLIDRIGPTRCLRDGVLPWRSVGDATVIVTAHPDRFRRHRDALSGIFGTVIMAVAPANAIEAAVLRARGPSLARLAETSVNPAESCRNFNCKALRLPMLVAFVVMLITGILSPILLLSVFTTIALLVMVSFNVFRVAAGIAAERPAPPQTAPPHIARLPVVSVMVALYHESDIATRLVKRLGNLNYPRELLDILLVVEADDSMTRNALATAQLPSWMRVVVVPGGSVKTKPRALNFALDHCRGSIVGIYDAEDAPEADQIRKVVERFHARGPEVACLQGVLDFYNPRSNWLSRCFTIEYATWFRILLPGIEKLGLAVPLGGTTLFFRRAALERLGRWDAHNVTEDADLGMRIARHGFRTELIDTVTQEEANCRVVPWIKQRSRWIKGFMMTWATHMRTPRLLWRQLGTRRFIGFQMLLLGSVLNALLAPFLWSFWLVPLGFSHPIAERLPDAVFTLLCVLFFATEVVSVAISMRGLGKTKHGLSFLWVPTLYFYHPLATLAAYKAAWEMLTRPFYWEKTSHGHFDQTPLWDVS